MVFGDHRMNCDPINRAGKEMTPRMDEKEFRKTVTHYDTPGDAHFLTFSFYRRLPLLSKDRTRWWLVDEIARARQKLEFDLWAWVIMPEHVHLLVYPRLSCHHTKDILYGIKRPVGTKAIGYLKRQHSDFLQKLTVVSGDRTYCKFWQAGPGYDRNLNEPRAIHDTIDYIHQNPVRRGLVLQAEDWIWSSARDWAGLDSPIPLRVDRTVPTLHPTDM